MARRESRHRKKARLYNILVVPTGEVAPTRTYQASRLRLLLIGFLVFLVCVAITLAVLVYTPVAMYVPIPNPALEQRYGKQIVALQERLNGLAEDVLLLRDYNGQLRKALGENVPKDSLVRRGSAPVAAEESGPVSDNAAVDRSTSLDNAPSDLELSPDLTVQTARGGEDVVEGLHAAFPLLTPTDGVATQGFDPAHGHYGQDFAARKGTPVVAATDGYVLFAGWTYDDGNMVMISHGSGYLTVYKHLQALLTTPHATVKRGETIALVGSTGNTSYGPHLHFEVWKDGIPRDPNEYVLTTSKNQ